MQHCTACQKNLASIVIMDLSGGSLSGQQHLCAQCAEAMGMVAPKQLKVSSEILEDILSGMKGKPVLARPRRDAGCPGCGTTIADFKAKGRLGCPRCYDTFAPDLVPLLQRVHESAAHRGRLPGRNPATQAAPTDTLAELRRRLEDAVRGERYEEAARLRDDLRRAELEAEQGARK